MKKFLVGFLVAIIMSSISGVAQETNNTNDTIKFSVKSKFLGQDKNFNTETARVNITVDRLGKLVYIENYYLEGSNSLKFQSSAKYFDAILMDNNVSFNISRPNPGRISDRKYVFIERIILFNNKIIFNKTVNLSERYYLSYTNILPIKPIKPRITNTTTIPQETGKSVGDITNTTTIPQETGKNIGDFTVIVSPSDITVEPGDNLNFTLTILPSGGFNEPIEVYAKMEALGQVKDIGRIKTIYPPYPPFVYEKTIPDDFPPGITLHLNITAKGGGLERSPGISKESGFGILLIPLAIGMAMLLIKRKK